MVMQGFSNCCQTLYFRELTAEDYDIVVGICSKFKCKLRTDCEENADKGEVVEETTFFLQDEFNE